MRILKFLETQLNCFQANCAKLRVKLKFNCQFRVKLRESEVRDQKKKPHKVKANVEIRTGVQLHKITNLNLIGGANTTIKSEGPNYTFTYPYQLHPVAAFTCTADQPPRRQQPTSSSHHAVVAGHHVTDQPTTVSGRACL